MLLLPINSNIIDKMKINKEEGNSYHTFIASGSLGRLACMGWALWPETVLVLDVLSVSFWTHFHDMRHFQPPDFAVSGHISHSPPIV